MRKLLAPIVVLAALSRAASGGPLTTGPGITLVCSNGSSLVVSGGKWTCGTAGVGGSGTAGLIPVWVTGSTLGNSGEADNGTTFSINNRNAQSIRAVGTSFTSANSSWDALDTTAMATGVGGSIIFEGNYTSGGSHTALGGIKALKENSTSGDFGGDLWLGARQNGSGDLSGILMLRGSDSSIFALVQSGGFYVEESTTPTATMRMLTSSGQGYLEVGTSTSTSAAPLNITSMNGSVIYANWDASGNMAIPHLGQVEPVIQSTSSSSGAIVADVSINSTTRLLRWNATTSPPQIVGFTGGVDGRELWLENTGTVSLLLYTNNGNELTAANQMDGDGCSSGCFVLPKAYAKLQYNGTSSRWILSILDVTNTPSNLIVNGTLGVTSTETLAGTLDLTGGADVYIVSSQALSSGNSNIHIDTGGTGILKINDNSASVANSGTGGVALYGGNNSSTIVWSVDGTGLQADTYAATGQTTDRKVDAVTTTGSFDTTAAVRNSYGIYVSATNTISAGANTLTTVAADFINTSSGANITAFSLITEQGDVKFNTTSGVTTVQGPFTVNNSNSSASSASIAANFTRTAQTSSQGPIVASNTGTFNTTSAAITSFGVKATSTATRSSGANNLVDVGLLATGTASGQVNYQIESDGDVFVGSSGHLLFKDTSQPSGSGCSVSANSSDTSGQVTMTNGSTTLCTVTFNQAFPTTPNCVCSNGVAAGSVESMTDCEGASTTTMTIHATSATSAGTFSYICTAHN